MSDWIRGVVLREAERLEARKRSEASQPGVGEALGTVRARLSEMMVTTEGQ